MLFVDANGMVPNILGIFGVTGFVDHNTRD